MKLIYDPESMKHLYIIGNGFDIFTGLKTRYADFRYWLENNYPFIFENMQDAYDMDVEWWNDFEVQLGKLDVKRYISKFTPPEKSIDEILREIERRKDFEKKYKIPPSVHPYTPCADRLKGLFDILQFCFEKWVEHTQRTITNAQYINIEKEDSYFINFNYTDVLECLYEIPEERVLHIHGRAIKKERLIFGHNTHHLGSYSSDEDKVNYELDRYHKNPYEYIYKYDELHNILMTVECVHVYGFSFSPVDEDYIDWIYNNVPSNSKWEVSWYSDLDKQRIDSFVLNHWDLKDNITLIKLEDVLCDNPREI